MRSNQPPAFLDSLSRQTLRPSEIVIADAGSTDRTAAIIATSEQTMVSIHLIRAGVAFPGRARNLAAAQANNEWLAFIDAGINPEPDWLESLARRAQLPDDVDVVYGSYEPVGKHTKEHPDCTENLGNNLGSNGSLSSYPKSIWPRSGAAFEY